MSATRQSEPPQAIEPEPRAKSLGKVSGTYAAVAFAKKPALEAREAERIRRERLMAMALGATLRMLGISNVKAGEWLGGESVVRRLLSRERSITAYHLTQIPPHVRDALLVAFDQVLRPAENDVAND